MAACTTRASYDALIDFIPTEEYSEADAERAMEDAKFVVESVAKEIDR